MPQPKKGVAERNSPSSSTKGNSKVVNVSIEQTFRWRSATSYAEHSIEEQMNTGVLLWVCVCVCVLECVCILFGCFPLTVAWGFD